MAHLSDEKLILVVRHQADLDAMEHAVSCEQCARGLEMWKAVLEGLPRVTQETVSPAEMHHLQTMYRHHRPERKSAVQWIASLVRSSADPAAAAVRGGAMAEMFEYEAGPFSVMLENGPMQFGAVPVHGQVFVSDGGELTHASVILADDDGTAFVEPIDEFGEFHVEVTVPGRYSVTVLTGEGSFRLDSLVVGEPDSD